MSRPRSNMPGVERVATLDSDSSTADKDGGASVGHASASAVALALPVSFVSRPGQGPRQHGDPPMRRRYGKVTMGAPVRS